MSQYVDWFNFMSYDIHGTRDGRSKWTDSVVNPHTNPTGAHFLALSDVLYMPVLTGTRDRRRLGSSLAQQD